MIKARHSLTESGLTLTEIMIGLVIFLVFLIPIWNLYIHSYGVIQVSKDELLTNIVSACLISEFSNKTYTQLIKLNKDYPTGLVQNNIYDTVIEAKVEFIPNISPVDLYDYVEVKIQLNQRVLKPKPKIITFDYSVVVPRHF